jgi:predicted metalloprotease
LIGLAVAVAAVGLSPGTAEAQAQARAQQAQIPAPCPSLEGCYDYTTMQQFYDQIIDLVDQFSTASYAAMPRPTYFYIEFGATPQTGCGIATSIDFHFCPADDSIYVGQDQLWAFYIINGDAAAAFGIAHEWGHHVQHVAGVFDLVDTSEEQIQAENQADCIGGAFLRHLDDQGMLEPDDYSDMDSMLTLIAEAEGPERTHGTIEQRVDATVYGLDHGLASCSDFFPDAPLVIP